MSSRRSIRTQRRAVTAAKRGFIRGEKTHRQAGCGQGTANNQQPHPGRNQSAPLSRAPADRRFAPGIDGHRP